MGKKTQHNMLVKLGKQTFGLDSWMRARGQKKMFGKIESRADLRFKVRKQPCP
jgi:hypothetical protein